MLKTKIVLLTLIGLRIAGFFLFDLEHFLTLDAFNAHKDRIDRLYRDFPWQTLSAYFGIDVAVTALSLPGAAIMTLAGGAIFGLVTGTVIVSFASTIGATLAFLASRFPFRNSRERRFGEPLSTIHEAIRKDGSFYLFTLRLVPVFPFFLINLLMGLTPIRVGTFYSVSQVGRLAATLVYVNEGTQLARIERISDILSAALIASFLLLGLLPWIARLGISILNHRRLLAAIPGPDELIAT